MRVEAPLSEGSRQLARPADRVAWEGDYRDLWQMERAWMRACTIGARLLEQVRMGGPKKKRRPTAKGRAAG